jgi:hypothetical protein
MQIKFNIRQGDMVADISPKSLELLYEMSPVTRADLLRDMLYDIENLYNAAVKAIFPQVQD